MFLHLRLYSTFSLQQLLTRVGCHNQASRKIYTKGASPKLHYTLSFFFISPHCCHNPHERYSIVTMTEEIELQSLFTTPLSRNVSKLVFIIMFFLGVGEVWVASIPDVHARNVVSIVLYVYCFYSLVSMTTD